MKQELVHIYRELSTGKLSQHEALERIRAIKQPAVRPRGVPLATLQAVPRWEVSAPVLAGEAVVYSAHHVLLLGLPRIVADELASQLPGGRCVVLPTTPGISLAQHYAEVGLALFQTIRDLFQSKPQGYCLVQLVVADHETARVFAGLAGLIETATLEKPGVLGQIVFADADITAVELARQLRAERANPWQRVVRYTGETRLARYWRFLDEAPVSTTADCLFKEQGVYLITGGLGGLGLLVAKEILTQTVHARVVLCGRGTADVALVTLETLPTRERVEYRQADVNDAAQVQALIEGIARDHGQLNGIIHSAGILRDEFILRKSAEQFGEVLRPKVAGSEHLDLASQTLALDFFLLFSSIAVWAGNVGQADYAAANGFMDQFADYRNALVAAGKRHGKTLSIAWPHWLEGGMNIDAESMGRLEQRTGLRSLTTVEGMAALQRALASRHGHLMVMHGNPDEMRRALEAGDAAQPAREVVSFVAAPATVFGGELIGKIREFLRQEFAAVLKIPARRIETRAALENYGIDSILAMNLTSQLETRFGALPKTLFFEYQTIDELADYFARAHADKLGGLFASARNGTDPAPSPSPEFVRATTPAVLMPRRRRGRQRFLNPVMDLQARPLNGDAIAIVGLSGRYPQARDIEAFWANLREGKDCIVEVPPQRWDWRQYYSEDRTHDDAHFSKWGGFIDGADEFDPRFFNIAPREARTIDPQERLFLQHAWMAAEDAGYTRASLQTPDDKGLPGQVGVYVGVMYGEYNLSGSLASIANRVSYFLNLHGPSMTLDTMCSSSLTAIHLACQDLRLGRTTLALAGGVNLSIHPNKYTMLSGGQFISSDGHCQSFGEGGDGYIPGEGVGVVMLKRLSEAERDGNHIYGLIRGSALNHGGKTNGYTVPNPQAQAEVIRRAFAEAGVDPREVGYIEAHGTGTKLGDPIEVAALTKAFHEAAPQAEQRTGFCLIGSAKSNIGHCESAAGIAGVTKVLLQMKHGQIVPSLHSRRLNPHIDFSVTPFVVAQHLQAWQRPVLDGLSRSRIAGISSFGAGGSNAHLIIEEYRAAETVAAPLCSPVLLPLSARNTEQLEQRARDLLAFIERGVQPLDMGAVAWTLQIGREAMDERAAFVVESEDDLAAGLRAFLRGDHVSGAIARAQVRQHKDALADLTADPSFSAMLEGWIEGRDLQRLAGLWVKGLDLDWRRLAGDGAVPRLMSLPVYPFARESYWVAPAVVSVAQAAALHPLVHANVSDLRQSRYRSNFRGDEPFLIEGATPGHKILPPLLILEMLRAVVDLAESRPVGAGGWEWCNTRWGEPLVIAGERAIDITLFARGEDAIDIEIHSGEGATDVVHCQSEVLRCRQPAPPPIDLARLKATLHPAGEGVWLSEGQSVQEMSLLVPIGHAGASMLLQPELSRHLAQLLEGVMGRAAQPVSLECLRVLSAPPERSVMWLRLSNAGAVDVDLCDEHGLICVQLSGLRSVSASSRAVIARQVSSDSSIVPPESVVTEPRPRPPMLPREIPLAAVAVLFAPARVKPDRVRLPSMDEVPIGSVGAKPTLRLALPGVVPPVTAEAADMPMVRLFERGEGVFVIEIHAALEAAVEPLLQALQRTRQEAALKALLLVGRHPAAWRGGRDTCNQAAAHGLFAAVAAFPCPLIAVADGGALGAGLLLASVSDFLVGDEDGFYGFSDAALALFPSADEDRFFRERLGDALADELLYRGSPCSGRTLMAKGWACRVVPAAECEANAYAFADELAKKPWRALELLKTHLGRHLAPLASALAAVEPPQTEPTAGEVLVVRLGEAGGDTPRSQVAQLRNAFECVAKESGYKALVVAGGTQGFLPELSDAGAGLALLEELMAQTRACPVPLIAALEADVEGLAWLFALGCDAVVYSSGARYAASPAWFAPTLVRKATALSELRLGASFGHEVMLAEEGYVGAELQARVGTSRVVEGVEVLPEALRLAAHWEFWPRAALVGWKLAQAERLLALLVALPESAAEAWDDGVRDAASTAVPMQIALASAVVGVESHPDGVVKLTLHDRDAKNMFSPALVAGLTEAFAHVAATPAYKVVVLTGFDNYFATGGTVETLLAIQEGRTRFTDESVFQAPMDCALPVIAAIQGHAIGGGWSFGMFADFILLSEESRYLSPYMAYGFTPGAGSTLMLPAKIGYDLARETLMTAQESVGQVLKARGIALPVLPRREVLPAALALAARIARLPRAGLIAQKCMWTQRLRDAREDSYRRELEMHEQTFVRNTQTLATIQTKFGKAGVVPSDLAVQVVERADGASAASILGRIKAMLAQELFLEPGEIDEDTQFIDLGLDSITGVTWIRKINEYYGTSIEATKVYSHPTLKQLSGLVASESKRASVPMMTPSVVETPTLARVPSPAAMAQAAGVAMGTRRESLDGVISRLKMMLAKELQLRPEEIEEDAQFIDLGLDSITGVTWVRKINEHYGTSIEATKVYSHPTLAEIGRLVMNEAERTGTLAALASAEPTAPVVSPPAASSPPVLATLPRLESWRHQARNRSRFTPTALVEGRAPVAIIGMAGQFARAKDIDEFWHNLVSGRDCISEVPAARWDSRTYYQAGAPAPGKTNSKWMGALDEYDLFDPLFFNISPTEAECMEPQQRVFLQTCWHGIENAGYSPASLSGSLCGVFVGCGPSEYHQMAPAQQLSAQGFTGAASSILAARIAYFLNLRGPCIAIETACSSSLVAIASACDSLNAGNSDLALAGGVYVMAGPAMHIMAAQAGMLSADGRCFSFDTRANGFVPGEGVGVVLLKRLADAQRDQDRILAVVEGWGINQDGKTNGITAPNEDAQTHLLQSVYRRFGIDPAGIQLIEAHGTGTKLGDPIEVAGLKAAFEPFTDKTDYCALGSVKSSIGHCLTAAGVAGVIKLVLALRHCTLPPTINYQHCNEHIQLGASPFYINDRLRPWEVAHGERRRAAVSSFGFSGTNAHLVLAEPPADARHRSQVSVMTEDGGLAIPLSARTEQQLRQKARDLLAYLHRYPKLGLMDIAYTLQIGRDAMGERLCFLADSVNALAARIEAYLEGRQETAGVYQGQVKRHQVEIKLINQDDEVRAAVIDKWLGQHRLSKLLDLWVKGLDLDWLLLYGEAKPQRIELPNYPFAKERYWFSIPEGERPVAAESSGRALGDQGVSKVGAPTEFRANGHDNLSYVYRWLEVPAVQNAAAIHKSVLIVCTDTCFGLETVIRSHYERSRACEIVVVRLGKKTVALSVGEWACGVDDVDGFRTCLQAIDKVDALYFLACSERPVDPTLPDELLASQERNEIQLLRLAKSLKRDGKIDGKLDAYVLTLDSHSIHYQPNRYWGAGASGLAYSLAQGNHLFRVRNLDLSSEDLKGASDPAALIAAVINEPSSDRGEVFKIQQGRRYRQTFFRLEWDAAASSGLKQGGVYLIIGGGGIVGGVITRSLIRKYGAKVVWLGRSARDSKKVQDALRAFSGFGDRPLYVQADTVSEDSLRRAVAQIKKRYSRIDGAIFAGMVFGGDDSVEQVAEAEFRSILDVKTCGSRAFYAALRNEQLDFMCYFSSGQAYSFSGAAKLAAYATGITFSDSFVRFLQGCSSFPVGLINWGFWQAAVRERIEKIDSVSTKSLGVLGDDEGFECFERFVAELQQGRLSQVLCMRASSEVESLMNCSRDELVRLASGNGSSPVSLTEEFIEICHSGITELIAAQQRNNLNEWFARLLFCQLNSLVESAGIGVPQSVSAIRAGCGIVDKYSPWLIQSFDMLAGAGHVEIDGDLISRWNPLDSVATWVEWRSRKEAFLRDPDTKALTILADECLEKLLGILQGRILATDVIFPHSSVEKVSGLYRNNSTADTFNEIVASTVLSYLRQRLRLDPRTRLRILEVGAGTGGTSAAIFAKLSAFKDSIEQYCFTDLSKAFFFHAEKNYLPDNPYIVFRRLDIERPIDDQGIEIGSYDLLIATNALHATKDMRKTLRHAKTALCRDGLIIISEMCERALSTHLTFGLLDGWWLFQDAELRIPGCPGLYPATWQQILEEEGFSSVLLPVQEAQALGNQVIVARSDGVIRFGMRAGEESCSGIMRRERPQKSSVTVPRDISAYIRNGVLACLSATLKIPVNDIEADIAFSDYGIDSILGVNFIDQVNARFAISLNTATIFEYSSGERLSKHISEVYGQQINARLQSEEFIGDVFTDESPEISQNAQSVRDAELSGPSSDAGTTEAVTPASMEIAIIGMSGMFPKASNVARFWDNLIGGVDGVEELPAQYLDQTVCYSPVKQKGKTRCKWAGILADRDCFDPLFFSISPKEAESMNPHQRLVMQEGWNAIEDAGYNPKALSGSQAAVFIGAEPAGYVGGSFTGLSDAIVASRLSYALNFNGSAFVVNTGCSSSAVAIHLACESLRNRESELVLAGGVNACLHQDVLVRLDQIEMLSPSGRCHTFDKAGDGTIISEGVGMIVLKRLDDAIASGDHIYATICGSGMNQDGASNGITAPNGVAQEQLIVSVYDRFGINPEQIGYVEAHGTGTKLGDPVETNALVRAFRKYSAKTGWCAVGSAKSHIGHAAAAAGVIGIIKILLSIQHKRHPKLLNFKEMNPLIQFDGSPFHIVTETSEWEAPSGVARMAAINSFGHSGTNVHMVVKEHLLPVWPCHVPSNQMGGNSFVIILSARTDEQLRQKCEDLLRFIRASSAPVDLMSTSYTLQVGRESMDERLGFVVDSADKLAVGLQSYIDGEKSIEGVFRGQAKRNGETVTLEGDESAHSLLDLWIEGRTIDWCAFWAGKVKPRRMSLPGYPFAKERYWMESAFTRNAGQGEAVRVARSEAIADIINRIVDDAMEIDESVRLLKTVI